MKKDNKKTIAFLLGAGCEGSEQINLPSGADFKKDTILATDVLPLMQVINDDSILKKYKLMRGPIIGAREYSILYQTIIEQGLDSFTFNADDTRVIENYLDYKTRKPSTDSEKAEKDAAKDRFEKIYHDDFYSRIKDANNVPNANLTTFLNNACFFSAVDSLFNYLRKPQKYPNEVGRVMKLYHSAYRSVLLKIIDQAGLMEDFVSLLDTKASVSEKRVKLAELTKAAQDIIVANSKGNESLYYHMIGKKKDEKNGYDVSIITTNYTAFARSVSGLSEDKIAYVHGRLDLFEDVNTKRVAALTDFNDDSIIFPFIFVQSGIKPIVNSYQIREFQKAATSILESEVFIILGYGVNSDDEHISNLLRERLNARKKIDYFIRGGIDGEKAKAKIEHIRKELQDSEELIHFRDSADFGAFLDEV